MSKAHSNRCIVLCMNVELPYYLAELTLCLHFQVEVIPCAVADCEYGKATDGCNLTVYVGGLYGTLRAADVAEMFRCLFGDVEAVTLFTDRHDYPTGKAHLEHTSSTKQKQQLYVVHYVLQLSVAAKLNSKYYALYSTGSAKVTLCDADSFRLAVATSFAFIETERAGQTVTNKVCASMYDGPPTALMYM